MERLNSGKFWQIGSLFAQRVAPLDGSLKRKLALLIEPKKQASNTVQVSTGLAIFGIDPMVFPMSKKVLFVCTGNTCRSPMAEGLFRKAVERLEAVECIGSAGVAAFPGDTMSPETAVVLEEKGAAIPDFRSRAVTDYLLDEATHVFAMTGSHLAMLTQSFPDHAGKCHLVCDFVDLNGRVGADVPDPIGMGPQAYQSVARVLELAIPGILGFLDAETVS